MKKVILAAVSGFALIGAASVVCAGDTEKTEASASMDKEMPSKEAMPAEKDAQKKPMAHKKHHKHHHHKDGRVELDGVYVTLPVNVNGTIEFLPEHYAGNTKFPYLYHGGYFWYPHPQNNMMQGYTPHCANGMCWYASYMHPHMVYIQGENMVVVHPYAMDGAMYDKRHAPMTKKWDSAPVNKTAE